LKLFLLFFIFRWLLSRWVKFNGFWILPDKSSAENAGLVRIF
jgi:hypothetical protein